MDLLDTRSAKNLDILIALVKGARNKAVSELTYEEKHSVAFFCNVYPIDLVDGKLKYNKLGKRVGLSVSYVWANSIIKPVQGKLTQKAFVVNSAHFYYDEEMPEFREGNIKECLEVYPEQLLIPTHKSTGYEHLPRLIKPVEKDTRSINISFTLISIMQEVALYSRFRKEERPAYIDFIMNEINYNKLVYLELVEKLETILPGLSQGIEIYDTDRIFKRINYDENKHDLQLNNKLAIVMIWAKQGIYLNSKSMK